MKSINFKIGLFAAVYFIMAFIAVFVYTMQLPIPEDLLSQFTGRYRLILILENFVKILPVLFLTAILVSYSWNFAKFQDEKESYTKQTVVMTDLLKRVFVLVLVSLVVLMLAFELAFPVLENSRQSVTNSSRNYKEFTKLVQKSLSSGDYVSANLYANQVLRILPDSLEAKALVADVEKKAREADTGAKKTDKNENKSVFAVEDVKIPELIEMAKKAFAEKSYFDAHYYSTLALQSYNLMNANLEDAKKNRVRLME